MSKKTKQPPAPKKAPKTSAPGDVKLVSLASVKVRPSGRQRPGQFDAPAKALVAAYEAGQEGASFPYTVPEGKEVKDKRSFLYNTMQKSLQKCSDKAWGVRLHVAEDGKTIYISIQPRK